MTELIIFPWQDKTKTPFWKNPENGIEWWIDENTTQWANRKTIDNLPKLNAICFYVVKDGQPQERVLIEQKTNNILANETNLEAMACKIDILRLAKKK